MNNTPLLQYEDLHVTFETQGGNIHAVNGIDLTVHEGEIVGVVGESGCGKTVACLAAMGLLGKNGCVPRGRILHRGEDLADFGEERLRSLRGDRISMIFQDPMTSLNPFLRISTQMTEVLRVHRRMSRREALAQSIAALGSCGMPSPDRWIRFYPHQLSGGMRQRVMIATALALKPDVLFADEPTTALDVTIQAQILELLRDQRRETGTSIVLVTHDLAVVSEIADRVVVMYAGRILECGDVRDVLDSPGHPYTRGLLGSVPDSTDGPQARLQAIPGSPPDLRSLPAGCVFAPRCDRVLPDCREKEPLFREWGQNHNVRCPVTEAEE